MRRIIKPEDYMRFMFILLFLTSCWSGNTSEPVNNIEVNVEERCVSDCRLHYPRQCIRQSIRCSMENGSCGGICVCDHILTGNDIRFESFTLNHDRSHYR